MASKMSDWVRGLAARLRCEAGQAVAEYGLILALIAAVVIVVVTVVGLTVSETLTRVAECRM